MKLEELRLAMEEVNERYRNDPEVCHAAIDDLLLTYIDDEGVDNLFNAEPKWYA